MGGRLWTASIGYDRRGRGTKNEVDSSSVPNRPVRPFGGVRTDYTREGEDRTDYRGLY